MNIIEKSLCTEIKSLKEYIAALKVEKHSDRAFEKSEFVSALEFAPTTPVYESIKDNV